jgi:SAM-dependent methyltransferase
VFQNLLEKFSRPFLSLRLFFQRQKRIEYEVNRYYHNSLFKALDLKLKNYYSITSPYEISKGYQELNPSQENLYLYGETPLNVYEEFSKKWNISEKDTFLELGSGIGRGLFFLASFFHCKCIGVEWVSEYVNQAKKIAKFNNLKDVYFVRSDIFEIKFPQVNYIYLFGSCLKTEEILSLCSKFKLQTPNAKIITVSFPLSFYDESFEIIDELLVEYEFGKTSVYLNKITNY